jgi:hypothetical protein
MNDALFAQAVCLSMCVCVLCVCVLCVLIMFIDVCCACAGSVKYCNVLAVLPMWALGHVNGEFDGNKQSLMVMVMADIQVHKEASSKPVL